MVCLLAAAWLLASAQGLVAREGVASRRSQGRALSALQAEQVADIERESGFTPCLDNRQIHFVHHHRASSNPSSTAVLFLPGFGAGSFQFTEVCDEVARSGHDAYVMDWFGQGRSWPEVDDVSGLNFGIETWALQLRDFLDSPVFQHHDRVIIAGNSVGGFVAGLVASRDTGSKLAGAFLLNPTPFWSFWGPEGSPVWDGTLPGPAPLEAFGKIWFDTLRSPAAVTTLLGQVYASPKQVDAELATAICQAASHPVGPRAFASILFAGRARESFDEVMGNLAAKNFRLALCYGREDPWIQPIWGQRAYRRASSPDYFEISPSGHCPHHETPAATAALLVSWLNDQDPAPPPKITERDGREVTIEKLDGKPRDLYENIAAFIWG